MRVGLLVIASLFIVAASGAASGQLRSDQVLVVHDSRIPDSTAVATYYAAARPGVKLVNLATLSPQPPVLPTGDVTYAGFIAGLRDPLRAHLTANGLTQQIRSIVLTKGLPHRINSATPGNIVGDNPPAAANAQNVGNYTDASVDSELTLLWQNLSAGEAGGGGDSRADGYIWNPYFVPSGTSTASITTWPSTFIASAKTIFNANGAIYPQGFAWRANPSGSTGITPGDIYLVCRLDGLTVNDVRGLIDRSINPRVDLATSVFVLDESAGLPFEACAAANNEYDNNTFSDIWGGDDYEKTRDRITGRATVTIPPAPVGSCTVAVARDFRFPTANVRYDSAPGPNAFFVGPRGSWGPGVVVVPDPVLVLATEGVNHGGGIPAGGDFYESSFQYAPGAFFNTIESFNGRNFGGIGGWGGQGQVADFIAAGGSFAIGSVHEPFTITVPRTNFFVRNWVQGNLSFAEAAYSSIPVLSYQQIVVGDPLARLIRSTDDLNHDGLRNIDDLYAWHAQQRDVNGDNAVSTTDRRALETMIRMTETFFMVPK